MSHDSLIVLAGQEQCSHGSSIVARTFNLFPCCSSEARCMHIQSWPQDVREKPQMAMTQSETSKRGVSGFFKETTCTQWRSGLQVISSITPRDQDWDMKKF